MNKKNKESIDRKVIKRYLNSQGDETDRQQIAKWFASPRNTEVLKSESLHFWQGIPDNPETDDYDEERILDRLNHLLRLEDAKISLEKRRKQRWLKYASRIAASLFIPLLFFSFLQWKGFFEEAQDMAYSSIYSPLGARTRFHLPDGSEGWLNGGSTLHFPAAFAGDYREVRLEGEAYFDVVSDARKPFVVTTDRLRVAALGTAFNVSVYGDDKMSKITLESGLVKLFAANDTRMQNALGQLKEGFQFTYYKDLGSHLIEEADVKKVTSWKEGKLVFRDDSMAEVVNQLNRWYNVEIVIQDQQLERHAFRATFQDETLDEVLRLIKLSSPRIQIRELNREALADGTLGKRKFILSLK